MGQRVGSIKTLELSLRWYGHVARASVWTKSITGIAIGDVGDQGSLGASVFNRTSMFST